MHPKIKDTILDYMNINQDNVISVLFSWISMFSRAHCLAFQCNDRHTLDYEPLNKCLELGKLLQSVKPIGKSGTAVSELKET
jgi:hypothetical protein